MIRAEPTPPPAGLEATVWVRVELEQSERAAWGHVRGLEDHHSVEVARAEVARAEVARAEREPEGDLPAVVVRAPAAAA